MEYLSNYLEFKQVPYEGKTKRFEVISVKHGYSLGRFSWYGGASDAIGVAIVFVFDPLHLWKIEEDKEKK